MSAANAGMTEMEQAMENLRNSPLRPDQVTKIQRMARVDKLQVDRARALHQPAACMAWPSPPQAFISSGAAHIRAACGAIFSACM